MTDTVPAPAAQHTTAEKLAELRARLELAKEPGGEAAVAKRNKKGIPSARSRVHALVDPGTFGPAGTGSALLVAAARAGTTRLIDNLALVLPAEGAGDAAHH